MVIAGDGVIADELRGAAVQAGYEVRSPHAPTGGVLPALVVDCGCEPAARAQERGSQAQRPDRRGAVQPHGGARLLLCAGGHSAPWTLAAARSASTCFRPCQRPSWSSSPAATAPRPWRPRGPSASFRRSASTSTWVGDAPGLVLGRIVCQVINESAFALGEGVGEAEDIDTGMVLGLSHPRGPLAWADEIGLDHVLTVLERAVRGVPRGALPARAGAAPHRQRRAAGARRGGGLLRLRRGELSRGNLTSVACVAFQSA